MRPPLELPRQVGGGYQGDEYPADESQRQSEVGGERAGELAQDEGRKERDAEEARAREGQEAPLVLRLRCGAGVGRNGRDARPGRRGAGSRHESQPRTRAADGAAR